MQKHLLLSKQAWKIVLQRDIYARLAFLALLLGLLVFSGGLTTLAPSCQAKDSFSCHASFLARKGIARLPASVAPTSGDIQSRLTRRFTELPPKIASFIDLALPYALQAHKQLGWPTSVILAQWGLEQGWQTPRFTGYNWGNCGAIPNEPMVPGTTAPGSPRAFAYAPAPEDGLRIYLHVAHLKYYTAIAPAAKQSADAAARALGSSPWDAGHYTDHNDPGSSLLAIMQNFNLYRYDI